MTMYNAYCAHQILTSRERNVIQQAYNYVSRHN
jgi:hypothetical protein